MRRLWMVLVPLLIALLPLAAAAQALPDNPSPAKADDPLWSRVQHLPNGEKIKVKYGNGPAVRCLFAGATDKFLYCDPSDAELGMDTVKFDRAGVFNVKADHNDRNGRLVFGAFIVAGGLWAGIRGAQIEPESATAVFDGLVGAGLGALVGYPFACLAGHCPSLNLPFPPLGYGFNVPVPLGRFQRMRVPIMRLR